MLKKGQVCQALFPLFRLPATESTMEDASSQLLLPIRVAPATDVQVWLARHAPHGAITIWNAFVPYLSAVLHLAVDTVVTCAHAVMAAAQ